MKKCKVLLSLILCALIFLGLSGFTPALVNYPIKIEIDGEVCADSTLKLTLFHNSRARAAGGFLPLYKDLRKEYSSRQSLNYISAGLGDFLQRECDEHEIMYRNAQVEWLNRADAPFSYIAEKNGRKLDYEKSAEIILSALDHKKTASLTTSEWKAEFDLAQAKKVSAQSAVFATYYGCSQEPRKRNIERALALINGTKIESGEDFSFNEVVGERTAERGFEEANVIVDGEFVPGVGGGVCQVSTTLYNAALLAGLKIKYASAHSRPVSYVSLSRDCTVSELIDFIFTNNTNYPIYISAYAENGNAVVKIYGENKDRITLIGEEVEKLPFNCVNEKGEKLHDLRGYTLIKEGVQGVKSVLYAEQDGRRTIIRMNTYRAIDAIYSK